MDDDDDADKVVVLAWVFFFGSGQAPELRKVPLRHLLLPGAPGRGPGIPRRELLRPQEHPRGPEDPAAHQELRLLGPGAKGPAPGLLQEVLPAVRHCRRRGPGVRGNR